MCSSDLAEVARADPVADRRRGDAHHRGHGGHGVEAADAVAIATPMHNFGVPAALKAWVDQIVRIHRTFRSTPQGKVGLLADRPVFVAISSGGWFTGPTPTGAPAQPDFLRPYLRTVFETIGIRSVAFATIEGAKRGPEFAERALAAARARIAEMAP